jgi:hypothetical protein
MFAKPELVAKRRLRRRLKAAASLALAFAAGAFLACKQKLDEVTAPKDDATVATGAPDTDVVVTAAGDAADAAKADGTSLAKADAYADATDALAAYDADADADAKKPVVDAKEHKKGMPVTDNLLE